MPTVKLSSASVGLFQGRDEVIGESLGAKLRQDGEVVARRRVCQTPADEFAIDIDLVERAAFIDPGFGGVVAIAGFLSPDSPAPQ